MISNNVKSNSKIRIAYIINTLSRMGGSERQLLYLIEGLVRETEGVVFCLFADGDLSKEIENFGFSVANLRAKDLSFISVCQLGLAMARRLRKEAIDLVFAYGFGPSFIGGLAARLAGVPFVSARRELAQWRGIRHKMGYAFVNLVADAITANSPAVAEVTERELFARKKIYLIPNGVPVQQTDVSPHRSQLPPNPGRGKVVGTVANYRPVKNIGMLLDAVPHVLERFPDTAFWIIGEGVERSSLDEKIRQLNVTERVFLTGSREDVPTLLSHLNVFALTSLAEGCPNAILEAMACGLPVVATNVGGVPYTVSDGNTGFLVPVGDCKTLAKRIIYLLSNSEISRKMGEEGLDRVRRYFNLDRLYQDQHSLYIEVLTKSSKKGPLWSVHKA